MQLTCTLAISAFLIVADAAACNLSTGTAPFAVAAVPSAEAGDALRAPALPPAGWAWVLAPAALLCVLPALLEFRAAWISRLATPGQPDATTRR